MRLAHARLGFEFVSRQLTHAKSIIYWRGVVSCHELSSQQFEMAGTMKILAPVIRCFTAAVIAAGLCGHLVAEEAPLSSRLYSGAVAIPLGGGLPSPLRIANPEEMKDVTLQQVLERIEELTFSQVRFDRESLTSAGLSIERETMISEWPQGEPIGNVLHRLPGQGVELTWIVEKGLMTLTTREHADLCYTTKRYYIGDLLGEDRETRTILYLLENQTSGPWDCDEPGTGTISAMGNHLIVRQTFRVQDEVQGVLAALRHREPIVLLACTDEGLRQRRALHEEAIVSFDLQDVTLLEFCQQLGDLTGMSFKLDQQPLSDAGLDAETKLNARAKGLPLEIALRVNLMNVNGVELTVVAEDDVILLTTVENANLKYETILYNLESLGITGDRLDEFVAVLETETSGPWDRDEPGTGTVGTFPLRSAILVRQTSHVQREILEILSNLRTLPTEEPLFSPRVDSPTGVQTRVYSMPPGTTESVAVLITDLIAEGTWREELKDQPIDTSTNSVAAVPSPKAKLNPEQKIGRMGIVIARTSNSSVEGTPAPPEKGHLVITHNHETHLAIEKLLQDLDIIPKKQQPHAGGKQGGGAANGDDPTVRGGGGGFFDIPMGTSDPKR